MNKTIFRIIFALFLPTCFHVLADAPSTEYFVIDTAKLIKIAPNDKSLDKLSRDTLTNISMINGYFQGGPSTTVTFESPTFRMDARLEISDYTGRTLYQYLITAGSTKETWDIVSESGQAEKLGTQYVTTDWRKKKVVVLFRFLNLKH